MTTPPPSPNLDGLSADELRQMVIGLLSAVAKLEAKVGRRLRGSPEHDVRDPVTLRKISGGTRSDDGRRCRDTFLSLKKTCQKNTISFWAYLGDRLGIAVNSVASLTDVIRARAAPAPT